MYKLYWSPQTAALAPEIILELCQIPYEKIIIDMEKGQHKQPDFLAINPMGTVPVLVTPDGEIVTETIAILMTLCERHSLDFMPAPDHPDRSQFLRYLSFLTNTIQPTYRRWYVTDSFIDDPEIWPQIKKKGIEEQLKNWSIIEAHLLKSSSPYMIGSDLSIADIMVAMLVTWHPGYHSLLQQYPAIGKCFKAVLSNTQIHKIMTQSGDIQGDET